ncbi:MAG: hypothetical protein GXX10_01525 [Clostridiaceae bacterium]|nr:hypothetical protein [Clostridiaceae bacterium]
MKRAIMILIIALMLGLCASASTQTVKSIDELLAPYQAVIDKLNAELGATFHIPYENREKVYNNIKHKTPDEFEALLRQEYDEFLRYQQKDLTSDPSGKTQPYSDKDADSYIYSIAIEEKSGLDFIPNFSGPIPFILLN